MQKKILKLKATKNTPKIFIHEINCGLPCERINCTFILCTLGSLSLPWYLCKSFCAHLLPGMVLTAAASLSCNCTCTDWLRNNSQSFPCLLGHPLLGKESEIIKETEIFPPFRYTLATGENKAGEIRSNFPSLAKGESKNKVYVTFCLLLISEKKIREKCEIFLEFGQI